MRTTTVVVTALLAGLGGLPAGAQAQSGAEPPAISMWVSTIKPDGAAGSRSGGSLDFVVGKQGTHYLFAGSLTREDSTVCGGGQAQDGVKSLQTLLGEFQHVWQISATAVKVADGRFFFDLDWKRYAHGGSDRPVGSGRQQLALTDGQRHVIDLLHAGAAAPCVSVVVDIGVQEREDPAVADEALDYDLWLVHTDPAGRKRTHRVVLTGLHGARMPFAFPSLRFEVPRLLADQYNLEVVARIGGEIRGRLNADGTVWLELSTTRRDTIERRGDEPIRWMPGGSGRKLLTLRPGEAVEVEIPVGGGTMGTRAREQAAEGSTTAVAGGLRGGTGGAAAAPSGPVLLRGNSYVVNFGPFFEGHRVTLIIQAKRQE
jgi:hypothetical protein